MNPTEPHTRRKLKFIARPVALRLPFNRVVDRQYVGLEHIRSWTGEIKESDDVTPEGLVSLFEPGDILFGKLRPYLAKVALATFSGVCSTEVLVLRLIQDQWAPFIQYVLSERLFIDEVDASTYGAKMPRVSWEFIGSRTIALPDLATQKRIADFLDCETARIDQLIEKKQRLVELLEEKQKAQIHHAVTAGLGSPSRLVDSQLPWFGQIPEHWSMKPLRHLLMFQRGHDLPADERRLGGVPLVSSAGISSEHDTAAAKGPGIVTGRYGTIGTFYLLEQDYWPLNTTLYTRRIYGHPRYCWYLLQDLAHVFILNSSKSAVPGVDRNDIHSERVPVPPLSEQAAIAAWLEVQRRCSERIIAAVRTSVDRLHEFRSALITAAVTGQIDVDTWSRRGSTDQRLEKIEEEMAV